MSQGTLIYFVFYGRGEAIRFLLTHAKADWKDEVLDFPTFGARKAAGEFINGQVPVWIENGK